MQKHSTQSFIIAEHSKNIETETVVIAEIICSQMRSQEVN